MRESPLIIPVNGSFDSRFNQSLDWFFNSEYCTSKIPLNFLYIDVANLMFTSPENISLLPDTDNSRYSFSKGKYTSGDKVILHYTNEIYFKFSGGSADTDTVHNHHAFISKILTLNNIPARDMLLIGSVYENNNNCSNLARMLGCSILLIDYYELQTFFFHKVLGCDYNKKYNSNATKELKYLFGKITKPIRIIMMHELWEQNLLCNAVTGCLIDQQDINKLAVITAHEYNVWYKKSVGTNSIEQMLNKHYGSPDNVPYCYYNGIDAKQEQVSKMVNHCPGYPYDHKLLFTDVKMSVVPETFYYSNQSLFLTEKIYKVIYNHHPFTILGKAGLLKALKSRGYRTFSSVCDETYDDCNNDRKRLGLVIDATKQLIHSNNTDELIAVTEHNFAQLETNVLSTIQQLNLAVHNLINS